MLLWVYAQFITVLLQVEVGGSCIFYRVEGVAVVAAVNAVLHTHGQPTQLGKVFCVGEELRG